MVPQISFLEFFRTVQIYQVNKQKCLPFSNAFCWMKTFQFQIKFHQNMIVMVQMTINQHWFRLCYSAWQVTSHYLNQYWTTSLLPYRSLVQERCNSIANALELCLSWTNPSIWCQKATELRTSWSPNQTWFLVSDGILEEIWMLVYCFKSSWSLSPPMYLAMNQHWFK